MARKKHAGRPKGSKNKAVKRGWPKGWRKPKVESTYNSSTFSAQILNLQSERNKLLANIASIDKAISILKRIS